MKVKIVAIAKDKGAYIAEWIFHHLYFGFDAIDIYINRTSDNTSEILDKISRKHPNISYKYADWVDMLRPGVAVAIQNIIYAKAFSEEKERGEFTHILFIDIDEYWTPINFNDSIHECISSFDYFSSLSFHWFMMSGEEREFDSLPQEIFGYHNRHIKTLCAVDADIERMNIHFPTFLRNHHFKGSFWSDGTSLPKYDQEYIKNLKINFLQKKRYLIVHRIHRSEIEYISLLHRGRPGQRGNLKTNRNGFVRKNDKMKKISFQENSFLVYREKRERFFQSLALENELETAKLYIIGRADKMIESIEKEIDKNHEEIQKIFRGVTHPKVMEKLKKISLYHEPVISRNPPSILRKITS